MISPVVALLVSVALTPLVRAAARRLGAVAQPQADRWHARPTAMFGGVAIFAAVMTGLALLPFTSNTGIVMIASTTMFLLGLADDLLHLAPYQKLIGQVLVAATVVSLGLVLPWTSSFPLNFLITAFWLVGITNAVNMLDNMDGLAAGVSAIAAGFLGLNFVLNGQQAEAMILFAFGAALLGFLVYNWNPASIFMGDCGSMFVGFFLASCALLNGSAGGRSRSILAVLAIPVLVLAVPIFDTTLVTFVRKLAGRAASQGGRDHASHRLVALGLTEKRAVGMLYAFAVAGGLLATLVRETGIEVSLGAIALFTVALTFVGIHLARVRVYAQDEADLAQRQSLFTFLVRFSHKRRIFEVLLDVLLILLASYYAQVIVLGPVSESPARDLFLRTLPAAVALQLVALLAAGVYRGLWRYASLSDMLVYARGVVLGVVAVGAYAALVTGQGSVSIPVLVVQAILLFLAIAVSRTAFRVLRKLFPLPHQNTGRRVVIYGAGDGGELLMRELLNNDALQRVPVAFVDDDPRKIGSVLHGLVIGPAHSVAALCRDHEASELLISTPKVPPGRLRAVIEECERAGVDVRQMTIDLRALTGEQVAAN
jgi:UDP-GlcNAc:undecaprenyl-phosphate GlcNAc-1-phosphate transferase